MVFSASLINNIIVQVTRFIVTKLDGRTEESKIMSGSLMLSEATYHLNSFFHQKVWPQVSMEVLNNFEKQFVYICHTL